MDLSKIQLEYPTFYETVEYLRGKTFFFKKTLDRLLDSEFNYGLAERICKTALHITGNDRVKYYKNVDELVDMSLQFLKLQIQLEKTGKYLYSSFNEIKEQYAKNEGHEGPDYLWGLYLSEVFWKIHHGFTNFFLKEFVNNAEVRGTVIEIPCGNGFFLSEFLRQNAQWKGTGIDLADASVEFSKILLNANKIPEKSYEIIKMDFLDYNETQKFDRIICGEFLEHLEDPAAALTKFFHMLKDNGKMFLTVAVWAAHIDHIYLYTKPQEVRDHITGAGFKIEKELVQSVLEDKRESLEVGKIPISYAAILSKI